jgi:ABC-type transporter Mla subunit MlaD
LLERGLLYASPQLFAAQQLDELKRQSAQLERFNADLAITIGEQIGVRFAAAVAPISASLSSLNDNMTSMGQNLREGMGQGAADAVNAAANGELRALGHTLEALRTKLDGMNDQVTSSSANAANQIRLAGADFAEAAKLIKDAFEQLTARVGNLGQSLTDHTEVVTQRQSALVDQAMTAFTLAHEEATNSITAAIRTMSEAGRASATHIKDEVSSAITSATEESRSILRAAVSETSKGFVQAGQNMVDSVNQSVTQIGNFARSIERSEKSAADTAAAFQTAAGGARALAVTMSDAAKGFQLASTPVNTAAQAIQDAARSISRIISEVSGAQNSALEQIRVLANGLKETNTAAKDAWHDYQSRFAHVDEDLQKTLEQLTQSLAAAMEDFRKFAQNVDSEMSKAVGRFSQSLGAIEEHAEVLSDFVEVARTQKGLAAE